MITTTTAPVLFVIDTSSELEVAHHIYIYGTYILNMYTSYFKIQVRNISIIYQMQSLLKGNWDNTFLRIER
jgi:hypothetical protein